MDHSSFEGPVAAGLTVTWTFLLMLAIVDIPPWRETFIWYSLILLIPWVLLVLAIVWPLIDESNIELPHDDPEDKSEPLFPQL